MSQDSLNRYEKGSEKMLPKVIIHNSTSIDGSLTNFEVNLPLHYQTAGARDEQTNQRRNTLPRSLFSLLVQACALIELI